MASTLYDKLWQAHVVEAFDDGTALIYIDRHLVHEVTSAQAFEGMVASGRSLWRRESVLATADHNVPTTDEPVRDEASRLQLAALERNCARHEVLFYPRGHKSQGIVHIIGPEQGFTLPGTTLICGDSHTSTHGAFGALAFGVGTSEIEMAFAAQTLRLRKSKNMRVVVEGAFMRGVGPKDLVLHVISMIGIAGGTGHVIEYAGPTLSAMSMEGRMTVCNMAIEAGARSGLVAPDETTFAYLKGRPMAPKGALWDQAVANWSGFVSDGDAVFDREISVDASALAPQVTWGTNPEMGGCVTARVPDPADIEDSVRRVSIARALDYMGLAPGDAIEGLTVDQVFIGSCTNGRLEDLRAAAEIVKGRKKDKSVKRVLVVPGSGLVKEAAEKEGLDKIFTQAGFEWRAPGCSMCLAMNPDRLEPGERCASTSNRNFEGRQGRDGRTHLMSPAMAAAAAISGRIVDVRDFL